MMVDLWFVCGWYNVVGVVVVVVVYDGEVCL